MPAKRVVAAGAKARATTIRLEPGLQVGLEMLQRILKRPVNKMVNEAVQAFIEKRAAEVESDLEAVLARIKAYRRKDPAFELAIASFIDAEAGAGREDAAEGVATGTASGAGPSQTMVRELLSR